jgi:hypothetical protein
MQIMYDKPDTLNWREYAAVATGKGTRDFH